MESWRRQLYQAHYALKRAEKKADDSRSPKLKKQLEIAEKKENEAFHMWLKIWINAKETIDPELKKKWDQARKKFLKLMNKHRKNR